MKWTRSPVTNADKHKDIFVESCGNIVIEIECVAIGNIPLNSCQTSFVPSSIEMLESSVG